MTAFCCASLHACSSLIHGFLFRFYNCTPFNRPELRWSGKGHCFNASIISCSTEFARKLNYTRPFHMQGTLFFHGTVNFKRMTGVATGKWGLRAPLASCEIQPSSRTSCFLVANLKHILLKRFPFFTATVNPWFSEQPFCNQIEREKRRSRPWPNGTAILEAKCLFTLFLHNIYIKKNKAPKYHQGKELFNARCHQYFNKQFLFSKVRHMRHTVEPQT